MTTGFALRFSNVKMTITITTITTAMNTIIATTDPAKVPTRFEAGLFTTWHFSSPNEAIETGQSPSTLSNWAWTKRIAPVAIQSSRKPISCGAATSGDPLITPRNVTALGDDGKHMNPVLEIWLASMLHSQRSFSSVTTLWVTSIALANESSL